MRVGLDRSRFPGSHVTPGAPARKEVIETALDGPARTQSDVFLVFSRTGNPLGKTIFLRGQRKLTKNSSTDFTLLATIVTIVAEQSNFDAQEAQYTTKTTTPVATEGDKENKQNSEFSLVYFLALFLSRFKCAIFQRSLRQRRDALKSLTRGPHDKGSRQKDKYSKILCTQYTQITSRLRLTVGCHFDTSLDVV